MIQSAVRIALFVVSAGTVGGLAFGQSPAESLSSSFRKAVDRVRASVVAVRPLDPARPLVPGLVPPVGPFRPGELIPRMLPRPTEAETEASSGSGVVIEGDRGHILTNAHVLMGSSRAAVILADGRERMTSEIRRDPASDLAVLVIDPQGLNLTPPAWGDPGRLQPGDWVVAIGQPPGAAPAISAGIYSARRGGETGSRAFELLETDTAVSSIHSGGALVNLNGEVVGICMGLAGRRASSPGMSYAIPADRARRTADELVQFGRARHSYLGIQVEPAQSRTRSGPAAAAGVVVTSVTAGTPAALGGLLRGDAIVAAGGRPVTSVATLQAIVEAAPIGEELGLSIDRGGRRIEVKIRPQAQPVKGAPGPDGSPAAPSRPPETGREPPRVRSRLGERAQPDAPPPSPPEPTGPKAASSVEPFSD
jgi:serine protease Do